MFSLIKMNIMKAMLNLNVKENLNKRKIKKKSCMENDA